MGGWDHGSSLRNVFDSKKNSNNFIYLSSLNYKVHEAFCYIIIWLLITNILYPENSDKYTDILHQRDIWHGGKIIGKKVITVSTCMGLILNII